MKTKGLFKRTALIALGVVSMFSFVGRGGNNVSILPNERLKTSIANRRNVIKSEERFVDETTDESAYITLRENDESSSGGGSVRTVSPSVLEAVGMGVDGSACGSYAYDSKEITESIYDVNWLRSFYSQGAYGDGRKQAKYDWYYGSNALESANYYSTSTIIENEIGVAAPYVEMELSSKVGYSVARKVRKCESNYIFGLKFFRRDFSFELPAYDSNAEIYNEHLRPDVLSRLNECADYLRIRIVNGQVQGPNKFLARMGIISIFEKYGTHILWRGGFGGGCDVLFSAHCETSSVDLSTRVSENVRTKLQTAIKKSINGEAGVSFDLASEIGETSAFITQKLSAEFYGGKYNSFPPYDLNGLAHGADEWVQTIDDNPSIVALEKAVPLWTVLPKKYQKLTDLMPSVYEEYLKINGDKYRTSSLGPSLSSATLNDTYVVLEANNEVEFGDYWDGRKNKEFFKDLNDIKSFYNPDVLQFAGFENVKIEASFELYETRKGTKVGLYIDYGGDQTTKTPVDYDLANDRWIGCTLSTLGIPDIVVPLDSFMSSFTINFKFATNDRGVGFLHWDERGAKLRNFKIKLTYLNSIYERQQTSTLEKKRFLCKTGSENLVTVASLHHD